MAERALQEMLGRTNEQIIRGVVRARTRVGHDAPWPQLLEALEPIDPELAAMLRRIVAIPTRGPKRRSGRKGGADPSLLPI